MTELLPPLLAAAFGVGVEPLTTTPEGWSEHPVTVGVAQEDAAAHVGVLTGLAAAAARLGDPIGAPLTAVGLEVHETVPTREPLLLRSRRSRAGAARVDILLRGRILAEGDVELAGHDPAPRVPDLQELAATPIGRARFEHDCDVAALPLGLTRSAVWRAEGALAIPWIVEELADDGHGTAHVAVVAALLACAARAVTGAPPGAHTRAHRVRVFAPVPLLEPIRLVARRDDARPEAWESRAAMVDDDGVVYATAASSLTRVRLD